MLSVLTLSEAGERLARELTKTLGEETVSLPDALHRVLFSDIISSEDVPAFTRSTVDGYAVCASDTFGCSESIPALLQLTGEVAMGQTAEGVSLAPGQCAYVPTGGALPAGADAMVMLEYAERFSGDTVAIEKPAAPGQHLIFAGDDVKSGACILKKGTRLMQKDVGVLAALGQTRLSVYRKPRVTVLSTGDELVATDETPDPGQIRDVNGPMLAAQCLGWGAEVRRPPIVRDEQNLLETALLSAAEDSDLILLSGGSSAGARDMAADTLARLGRLLFHGLAVKPGKPTLAGEINGVPVIGLPGHPVAAFLQCHLLVRPLINRMTDTETVDLSGPATLSVNLPSNHGREEYVPVRLSGETAVPVIGKSGLIGTLARADGYLRIPRDTEGLRQGETVTVFRWETI